MRGFSKADAGLRQGRATRAFGGKRLYTFALVVLCLAGLVMTGCGKQTIQGPGGTYQGNTYPGGTYQGSPTNAGSSGSGSSGTVSSQPISDTSGQPVTTGQRGTTPYTVMGKTYYPMLSVDSYSEDGIASWYGSDFHGKLTANGERYDMHGMTAAHKLLPFGTMVKVTSLENGKSVVVRINDRGPFVENRVIDLTRSGSEGLDMLGQGTMRVRLDTIGKVAGLSQGKLQGKFYVQIGAFGKEDNAVGLVKTMGTRGTNARNYFSTQVNMWRVQAGPFTDLSAAERAADSLRGEFPHCFIVAD